MSAGHHRPAASRAKGDRDADDGRTGAAQSLRIEGTSTLFALPGVQLDYLFDALWEDRDYWAIRHTRHEQATLQRLADPRHRLQTRRAVTERFEKH